jgi:transposase
MFLEGWNDRPCPVRRAILYLPPCFPGFNPTEKVFSKLKTSLHDAAKRCWKGIAIQDVVGVFYFCG